MTRSNFFIRSFLLLALAVLASCGSDHIQNQSNAEFQKRFASEVSRINAARISPPPSAQNAENNSSATNPSTARIAGQNNLPDDMFDLVYNPTINAPFVVSGLEFDTINIPERDYYGIASTLNDKRYVLAGNHVLQRNIDELIRRQSAEDIEFSEILIKEQRQLKKQQKLAKIFGDDSTFIEKNKTKNEDGAKKEERPSIIDEALKKQIALQIIKQNITHNSATGPNKTAAAQQKTQ